MANDIEKRTPSTLARFRPNTDILEREDGFHIFMDMPGVGKDGLSIDLRENELEVRGGRSIPGRRMPRPCTWSSGTGNMCGPSPYPTAWIGKVFAPA